MQLEENTSVHLKARSSAGFASLLEGDACAAGLNLRLENAQAVQMAEAFKALGHPVRLQILDLLSQEGAQLCSCDLERHFNLTQPTISHHLRTLREAGLITSHTRGVWVHHHINPSALSALRLLLTLITPTAQR
jgi:ArsR family transcriptional regulator